MTENVPGVKFGFSQPIEMRVNELVAGVKSDVAVLIYGPDLDVLRRQATEVERVLSRIAGAQDIKTPTSGRLPMLRITVRRDQLARYGIKASDVLDAVAALGGTTVGTVFEELTSGIRCAVRLPESWRNDPEKIGSIRIVDPQGRPIALNDLADIVPEEGPSEVERENVQRRAVVGVNVRGRDIASFVAEAQAAIDAQVKLPESGGYVLRWGGQFEHLQTASRRLHDRRAGGHAPDLSAPVQHLPLAAAGALDLPGRADGGDRRRLRFVPASDAVLDLGRRRLHRAFRRGRAQRPGLGQRRRAPARRRESSRTRQLARRPSSGCGPILMTALVAGFGFIPDGHRHHPRRRDPAAPGHGRHRRTDHLDPPDHAGVAGDLPVVCREAEAG